MVKKKWADEFPIVKEPTEEGCVPRNDIAEL